MVVMPKDVITDRYSIAYFCEPLHDTELIRIPSDLVRVRSSGNHEPPRGKGISKAITAEEHLKSRLAAAYGWAKQDHPAID